MQAIIRLSGRFLSEKDSEHLEANFGPPAIQRSASVEGERITFPARISAVDREQILIELGFSAQFARVVRCAQEDGAGGIQWCGDGDEPAGYPPAL